MDFPKRIELTNEIEKVITLCPKLITENEDNCFEHCPLAGACLEYWTGDDNWNQDWVKI